MRLLFPSASDLSNCLGQKRNNFIEAAQLAVGPNPFKTLRYIQRRIYTRAMGKSGPTRPLTRALFHILIAPVRRERHGYGIKSRSSRLLPVRSRG